MQSKTAKNPGKPSGQGLGILQRGVIEQGFSHRKAKLAVDTVIEAWKQALARHEEVELPIGKLRLVHKERRFALPRHLKNVQTQASVLSQKNIE